MNASTPHSFLGSTDLARVLRDLQFTCLDIGARGGFVEDLLPLAAVVQAIGFEPDEAECDRLNEIVVQKAHPWQSLRFLPIALGSSRSARTLHIYHKRGCSSLFEANVDVVGAFGRAADFQLEGTVELAPMPLDEAAKIYDFADAVYLKIDVQGSELDILRSGEKLLDNQILAIRTEVEFISIYHGQPLFSELELYLRKKGFIPMGFVQLDHWRRTTRRKHPKVSSGTIPYSRGQIVHGDMLFFRDPALMPEDTPEALEALVKMAFLALVYEYVDHAFAIFTRPAVEQLLSSYGLELKKALHVASCHLLRRSRLRTRSRKWTKAKDYLAAKVFPAKWARDY